MSGSDEGDGSPPLSGDTMEGRTWLGVFKGDEEGGQNAHSRRRRGTPRHGTHPHGPTVLGRRHASSGYRYARLLHWVKGPQGKAFGKEFSEYCGAVQGTPCQSGSVALWGALRLLDIGPGDEVLVPSLTYIATATCVSLVGATPVFVDVEPDHWCVDLASLEAARTPRTKPSSPSTFSDRCAMMPC